MRNFQNLWVLFSFGLLPFAFAAGPKPKMTMKILSENTQEFTPGENCEHFQTCSLKRFKLIEMKKGLSWSDHVVEQRITDIRAIYETDKVENIQKFVIVQFIRGCYYQTWPDENKVTRVVNKRKFFGKMVKYQHQHWQIDSEDSDPVYNSDEKMGRFGFLRWNTDPQSFDANHPKYYFREKPKHPIVFATDLPGLAAVFFDETGQHEKAINSSLEFKTCLYHAEDVPAETNPEGYTNNDKVLTPEQAISCFRWDHKFAYDFKTKEFVIGGDIAPICLE